jgi:hypothetical protein
MLAVIVKSRCTQLSPDIDLPVLLGDLRAEDYNALYDFIAAECGLELAATTEADVTDPK